MTVGELKAELADFPDDLVVLEQGGHEIWLVEEDPDAVLLFWT